MFDHQPDRRTPADLRADLRSIVDTLARGRACPISPDLIETMRAMLRAEREPAAAPLTADGDRLLLDRLRDNRTRIEELLLAEPATGRALDLRVALAAISRAIVLLVIDLNDLNRLAAVSPNIRRAA